MARGDRYDRDFRPGGYDRGFRGGPRPPTGYDRAMGYGFDPYAEPVFPTAYGFAPMLPPWGGPGGGWGVAPGPYGARGPYRPPRRPEESPAYGRGGDRELLRWARERGYDVEGTLYPRRPGRR